MVSRSIDRVGVLGAGIMGSGIACHLANAGVDVLLLDIVPPDGKGGRNAFAEGAIQKSLKASPKPLVHPSRAKLIKVGNLEDDLEKLAECQWVVEAVKEDLTVKRALFERLEAVTREETIISSNTSGIPLRQLVAGRTDAFRSRFLITHFFNPVRYMRLLELVASPETDKPVKKRIAAFAEDVLGKGVVWAKDTPNFIANRIGTYGMMRVIREMEAQGATVEEIDAIFGPALGRPKSAVFQTADVVGLDLLTTVTQNCYEALTADPERGMYEAPAWLREMVTAGRLGRKSGGGFYRKAEKTDQNPKGLEVWDIREGRYRNPGKVRIDSLGAARNQDDLAERLKTVVFADDKAGKIAWPVIRDTLAYAANLVGEIADDPASIDTAMRWGFAWDVGPFETWDMLGFEKVMEKMLDDGVKIPGWVQKLRQEGRHHIYGPGGMGEQIAKKDPIRVDLRTMKARGAKLVKSNSGASLIDIGEGIFALEFHTKGNAIDADITTQLMDSVTYVEEKGRGLVIYNEGENFSFGANLMLIFMLAQAQDWAQLEQASRTLQNACQRIRYAKVPVIAAPHGMALGGGCEICLASGSAAGLRPYSELYIGLVEVGVGIIPGAGGTMNTLFGLLERVPEGADIDPQPFVAQAFKQIMLATVATSAEEARALGYVPAKAQVTMDRRRLLHDAKWTVTGLAEAGYRPPIPRAFRLPGESGIATIKTMVHGMVQAGQASAHDALIAGKLANVLCGGKAGHTRLVTEQEVLDLEREAFLSLAGEEKTHARITHMLQHNKPLRN